MSNLEGKVAVITEGSGGIGLAAAQLFASEKAQVFITGRSQNELDAAVKQIGSNAVGVQCDASNVEDLDRLYAWVKQHEARIDVLFANAGEGEFAALGSMTEEQFDTAFSMNVKGLLFAVQKALPLFQDGGSIILNASVGGAKEVEGFNVYDATNAAVRSFASAWAIDLKPRGIRVNVVSPGPIDTLILKRLSAAKGEPGQIDTKWLRRPAWTKEKLGFQAPPGRMSNPGEIAKAALFLASDDSRFVTGFELFVTVVWRKSAGHTRSIL
jgi:NAD(P)-dependent dehydrogenase (short-subunit alcohol dehydrogenase family)